MPTLWPARHGAVTTASREPIEPRPPVAAVTLFSAWRGMVLAHVTPLILLAIGTMAIVDAGANPISVSVVLAGVALAAVSLFDFPLRATLGPDGIERRCPLRRQVLPWSRITDLRRAPGPRLRRAAAPPPVEGRTGGPVQGRGSGAHARTRQIPGGLVAACGRRRYLLVDRVEGADEYDSVVSGVAAWAPGVDVHAVRPPADAPPTWLYRRRHRSAP